MNKKYTDIQNKIINIVKSSSGITAKEIVINAGITKQRFYVVIKDLVDKKVFIKKGAVPNIFYIYNKDVETNQNAEKESVNGSVSEHNNKYDIKNIDNVNLHIKKEDGKIIENNFYYITPEGEELFGVEAFIIWCKKRKENIEKTAEEYVRTLHKYDKFKKLNIINATQKAEDTFKENNTIDSLSYLDFYSIERFGKTKLGQMILYAKKSDKKDISIKVANMVKENIYKYIKKEKFDAVAFIPPTENRKYQFMKILEEELNINLPTIQLVKIKTKITVPQKTFSKIEDRIKNAESTIFINENRKFKKVLLIDDAVGSGATFNEVAKKIKYQNITKKVYALGIVGSFNGFEVINEA